MLATDGESSASPPRPLGRLSLTEELLDAALGAMRQGTLDLLVLQRPRAARWLMRPFMPVVRGTAGDAWPAAADEALAAGLLLRWLVTQLRPDLEPRFDGIDDDAWIARVAWRPALALMCHHRMLQVPAFPTRYRKRADEAAVDNLCGLWDVGPSTFYRYVERGKHQMAQMAGEPLSVPRLMALRRFVISELTSRSTWTSDNERAAWHVRQVAVQRQRGDAASALWHATQAQDVGAALEVLRADAAALAGHAETDALIERIGALARSHRASFDLWQARAALARTRSLVDRELAALEQALKTATGAAEPMLLGTAYAALGRFQESRDADRAFACYEDSARYLLEADPRHQDAAVVAAYMNTLVRLAWMHVVRNHPQAKAMLERADDLRQAHPVPDDLIGMLEQSWGEYWRVAGDAQRALQAKHRALNIFQRLGDQRSILVTFLNLISLHGEARELDRAQAYAQQVFEVAKRAPVEPSILVSTHGNLALAFVWAERYDEAIEQYSAALKLALNSDLRLHANRTRMNLASAYFRRFLQTRDVKFERLGDAELDAFFRSPESERTPSLTDTARHLKAETLGTQPEKSADRLLSSEAAEHLDEMAEIKRQRELLTSTEAPDQQVRARLAIANAYLAISVKEREAARAVASKHGLDAAFIAELGQLRATFDRELTQEQRTLTRWKVQGADLLDDARRMALVERLLRDGSINKSGYAELIGVSPATASKHLTLLTERGLLLQTGRGPSTRYALSDRTA